jgi:hypothetical protein
LDASSVLAVTEISLLGLVPACADRENSGQAVDVLSAIVMSIAESDGSGAGTRMPDGGSEGTLVKNGEGRVGSKTVTLESGASASCWASVGNGMKCD